MSELLHPKLGGEGDGDFVRGFRGTYGTVGLMMVYEAAIGGTGSPIGSEEEESGDWLRLVGG